MGRTLRFGERSGDGGDQRLDRLRPAPLPAGHRREQGPCGNVGQEGHHHGAGCKEHRSRSRHDPVRDRGRQVRVPARAGGHPHERRKPARRADRAGRRAPAYRALAQRSGRDRLPALGARRHRRDRRRARGLSAGAGAEGARPRRDGDAGLYASADGAAGDVRPSSAGLCGDGGARPRPPRRCAQAAQRKSARRRGARRHVVSDRPRS